MEDQKVLKSNHLDTEMLQKELSLQIVKLGVLVPVNLTIKLDRKLLRNAEEIKNIIPDAMLSAKLSAVYL